MNNLKVTADSPTDSPFAGGQTPRLSIFHLMLWTLCSAVHLTIYRAILAIQGEGPAGYANMHDATSVINGIAAGAIIAGTIVLAGTRIRSGPPMLRHPGHWILLVAAIQSLIYLPVMAGMLLLQQYSYQFPWIMFAYAAVMSISPLGFTLAAWRNKALRWKLMFLLLGCSGAAYCLLYVTIALGDLFSSFRGMNSSVATILSMSYWFNPILAVVIVIMAIGEHATGLRRDWIHWTGILTHVTSILTNVMWMIAGWIIR